MTANKLPKLLMSKAECLQTDRHANYQTGKELLETQLSSEQEFDKLESETKKWTDYNKTLFDFHYLTNLRYHRGMDHQLAIITGRSLSKEIISHKNSIDDWINELESVYERLDLYTELPNNPQQTMSNDTTNNENKKIFIGHGRSHIWRALKDFIEGELKLPYE